MTQEFLEEITKYVSEVINVKNIKPILIDNGVDKAYRLFNLYYYHNGKINIQPIYRYDSNHYSIINKHNITNIESYVSNTIIPEKKSFIDKWNHKKFNAYVYAMTDDSILYIDTNYNSKIIYDDSDAIEIDYTEDNLILINNL